MPVIVFEGGEGSGKTTQIQKLGQYIEATTGTVAFCTREPGGTPLAEEIRNIFKALPAHGDLPTPLTELLLVSAARAQHLEKVVRTHLEKGHWVIVDRFLDSTYVYQHLLGGLAKEVVDSVSAQVLNGFLPDLTLLLDVSQEVAAKRLQDRGDAKSDRMDSLEAEKLAQINHHYRALFEQSLTYPCGRIPLRMRIDADGSQSEVASQIQTRFHGFLESQKTRQINQERETEL